MRTPETIMHIIFEMFHMFNGHLGQNSYRETMSNAYDKQPLWITMGNTNNEMPFGPIAMPFHGTHHRRNTRTTPLSTSPTLVHGIYYIVYHWTGHIWLWINVMTWKPNALPNNHTTICMDGSMPWGGRQYNKNCSKHGLQCHSRQRRLGNLSGQPRHLM